MGFRVVDAAHAYDRARQLGVEPPDPAVGARVLDVPALKGIGGSLLYLVDRYGEKGSVYDEVSTGSARVIRSRRAAASIISTT